MLLKAREHPTYMYNDKGNINKSLRSGYFEDKLSWEMISMMFKGKTTNFSEDIEFLGYSVIHQQNYLAITVLNLLSITVDGFYDMFAALTVEHVETEESDHLELLICVRPEEDIKQHATMRVFWYEEMWYRHDDYEAMVIEAWESSHQRGRDLPAVFDTGHKQK